jgi:two-component system chemotaxis sensor kinase CheA
MNDDYLDAFIRESEEAITELNNSLLTLEGDPSDEAAMDSIFRTAHTLKGNFGAMGFDDASDLAHAIEDLLDEVRQGNLEVTAERMDLVFAGVDRIEAIVREIEAEGESSVETGDLVTEIRGALDDAEAGAAAEAAQEAESDDGTVITQVDADLDGVEGPVVRAVVDLGDTQMAGVDAMLTLDAVESDYEVVATVPDREAVEDGEFEDDFDVFVAADNPDSVADILEHSSKVASATVQEVDTDATAADDGNEEDATETDEGTSAGSAGGSGAAGSDEIKSVRVDIDQLDELYGLVEQLVTNRIKLQRGVEEQDFADATDKLNELDKITASLQNTVMDMRLIPLKKVVGKFPRLVRDLAREQGKQVDFEVVGEDIEMDRTILTEISDPLMHILRNAVDHGLEPPAEREAAGKDPTGTITLRADRERDHVTIQVEDDGGGLDVDAIREKAIERDLRSKQELEAMDDSDVYDLVFHPGFSTNDEVTDVSGRGVGMDVVHSTVTQLDGSVNVESTPGEGTTVSLRLPVTMAIVKVLFVEVGDEEYGIPIKNVDEISQWSDVRTINGREVVEHGDDIYPVVHLDQAFDVPGAVADGAGEGMLIRIRESERKVAIHCDAVRRQEEVVVKPLEGLLSGTPGLSGTAVLGDGNVVHILDVVTL